MTYKKALTISSERTKCNPLAEKIENRELDQRNFETRWTRSQGESAVASVSSALSPSAIDHYFNDINTDMAYSAPQPIPIQSGTCIQALEPHTVESFLAKQKHKTSSSEGPSFGCGNIFHIPLLQWSWSCSIVQSVPCPWKFASVIPIPKESPLTSCNQLPPMYFSETFD